MCARHPRWVLAAALLAASLGLGGCPIHLVADYDQATYEEILGLARKVDRFYGALLERPEAGRAYAQYSAQYVEIESDLGSLVMRNAVRPLNKESTRISRNILELWRKYKARHRADDGYRTAVAILDRKRFTQVFTAAASAEIAKETPADVKDPDKESRE